jgi:trigger factor
LRRQKATFSELNRGAKKGDRVELSYEGSIKGVKKDAMSAKNHPLILGDNTLIPGFEEEIVGMKKGEMKKFSLTFPEDYRAKDFAGQKADFEVELIDLKEVRLPELNDEFAKNFGHKNIIDLKDAVESSLRAEAEQKAQNEIDNELIEKILPKLKVEVPESLIDQELNRVISGLEEQLKSRGLTLDNYLKSIKKSSEELHKEMRPTAERNVRIGFLLGKIIEEQKIDTKDPEAGKIALQYLKKKIVS